MSPPKEACYSLGKDWDDSDFLHDLEATKQIQMVLVPAGPRSCSSAPYPRPLGEKGPGFSDIQRFEGFPWPDGLIPVTIAMTGKGIFFGSHKINEIYRKETGGITTPRGEPGATWVCVGCTSRTHTGSFATLFVPEAVRGGSAK